jgi:hypothetical protein
MSSRLRESAERQIDITVEAVAGDLMPRAASRRRRTRIVVRSLAPQRLPHRCLLSLARPTGHFDDASGADMPRIRGGASSGADAERRKLERNLHDGARQHFEAMVAMAAMAAMATVLRRSSLTTTRPKRSR